IGKALDSISREIRSVEIEEIDAQSSVEKRHEEYLNLGGDKIESLKNEIKYIKGKLDDVIQVSSKYQGDCRRLSLNSELNEGVFLANKRTAIENLAKIEEDTKQAQDRFGDVAAQLSEQQKNLNAIKSEILEIEARPDSNIDVRYQKLRDEMIESLGLPGEELVFIGELLDVKDDEKPWQGAIERALGGLKTTLLVPQKNYSMVTRWLNVRHTGLHVRAQVVSKIRTDQKSTGF